ncbi:30S ribosomal protein S3 [Candidatus Kaiserbacteria bacterium]|nr:30S ribosomal protein S3 [Candidatus Kaiserbacteria bacterium]
MTHTVHPYAHRLGILRDWKSRWFSTNPRTYREGIKIDTSIREFLVKRLRGMYVSSIEIERNRNMLRVIIKTSRPGLIIGRSGEGSVKLKKEVEKIIRSLKLTTPPEMKLDIEEVRSPESDAAIVSQMVAEGLEKRMPFRRVIKQIAEKVMANRDVEGVRIGIAGRLGGGDMARSEEIKKGRIPLQTFRADIDFAREKAYLPYGVIGVKVWIYRGEIFADKEASKPKH